MSYIDRCIILFAILLSSFAFSQENLTGFWQPKVALNYKVGTNYSHNFSVEQRNYIYETENLKFTTRQLDFDHFSKLKLTNVRSIAFGIKYRFREIFAGNSNELRFTQQFNSTHTNEKLRLGHRIRTEQRFTRSLTIHRFRYRFALDLPLNGETLDIGETYLVTSTESLLSVAKANNPQLDQRLSLDIGWLVSAKTKIQLGSEFRWEDYTQRTQYVLFLHTMLIFSL
ncbi:DUF2490 domain-containing protein [Sungkyunkwania multivorans]|uniref:DUF2490 domain-containing protein n=1 Tax=Sungkyunkwania multivorans TaxID=1173618 RepID=A0ABW3CTL9_9FLAO